MPYLLLWIILVGLFALLCFALLCFALKKKKNGQHRTEKPDIKTMR
jgi:membrane protein required for beta-lactamase induction